VNFKQFKYFKTDFQGIVIIVEPSSFIWFKNKTGSILGTLPQIPLTWGSQTTFQGESEKMLAVKKQQIFCSIFSSIDYFLRIIIN
jgi:hypothetical protein